jgi:hypothetical protein
LCARVAFAATALIASQTRRRRPALADFPFRGSVQFLIRLAHELQLGAMAGHRIS